MSDDITLSKEGGISMITLNNPKRLNALSWEMGKQFAEVVTELKAEPFRLLILRGAGRAFSAGGDFALLEEMAAGDSDSNRQKMLEFYQMFLSLRELNVPTLALLHGHAVGAGFAVAAACDIRLGVAGCALGFPFTRLGIHPGMGSSYLLERICGAGVAADLLLTGRQIDGDEALRLGLISELCQAGEEEEMVSRWTDILLSNSPKATEQLITTLRGDPKPLNDALQREALNQAECYASPEFLERLRERLRAVKEKGR